MALFLFLIPFLVGGFAVRVFAQALFPPGHTFLAETTQFPFLLFPVDKTWISFSEASTPHPVVPLGGSIFSLFLLSRETEEKKKKQTLLIQKV